MKKIILTPIYFILILFVAQGQTLTQSADGKSSIPLPLNGLGLSVDIGKSEVALGINNYGEVLKDSSNFLIGGNLSVKSADGVGSLFSSGDIVPAGNLLLFGGVSFSNNKKLIDNFNKSSPFKYHKKTQELEDVIFDKYKSKIKKAIFNFSGEINGDDALKKKTINELSDLIEKCDGPAKITAQIKAYGSTTSALDDFRKSLLIQDEIEAKQYKEAYDLIRENYSKLIDKSFTEFLKMQFPLRFTAFLQGGISARNFTRYIGLNVTALPKSFQDTLFRGGQFGVGLNLQVKNYWLGVTYSYIAGDNFTALKSKEYTLKTMDTTGNQQLTSEKKYTAYSGKYSKVETNELNIDIVGDFKLADTSHLLANLYLRGSLFSRDTSYLKNHIDIGAGLYFLGKKGKFIGGLYVELPDINNNFEKAKPADEINIRSPLRKLSFGIVTKFNLSSIFSFANRPAKSD